MLRLYEFPPTRSIRVRWVLQELGVEFESVTVNPMKGEHQAPEFLAVNPAGKLPALVDGDEVMTESVAIALYLAEKYPAGKLLPESVAERGQVYRWLLFAATELEQPLWRMARNTVLYPEDKRQPSDIELARSEFKAMATVLEKHMQGREFVVGDRLSVADLVLGYTLDWAQMVKLLGDFPQLCAYLERLYARDKAPMRIAEAFASLG